jgi:hypothetical protein
MTQSNKKLKGEFMSMSVGVIMDNKYSVNGQRGSEREREVKYIILGINFIAFI